MGLKYESFPWQRIFISLFFAALAAGVFSVIVLVRDQAIQVQLKESEVEQAELRNYDEELKNKLKAQLSEKLKLEEALIQERAENEQLAAQAQTAASAAKVALGVVVCTVLWDMTALVGNPFAVPGLVDNAVCGAMAAAIGVVTNPFKLKAKKIEKVVEKLPGN